MLIGPAAAARLKAAVAMHGAAGHAVGGIEVDECESTIEIMPKTACDLNTAVMNPSFVPGNDAPCGGAIWSGGGCDVSVECADPYWRGDISLDTVVNAADLGLPIGVRGQHAR